MPSILLEDSKYQKKYKCPYCDKRYTRPDLINHIDKKHSDMIPKDYTSTRVVFNMINKKDHGSCIICKKETAWNEDHARYERLCGSKSCHDKYVKIAHTNTKIDEKLRDPEFQQKMLAGRSISGTYKFADGNQVSYTGSYERQLLEFLDKFLGFKSYDVESPGPTIEYTYKGKKHFWITDQYLIPYNLVFDCKDGGDNPNKREMTEYREKQIAKEKAIKKQGKYNYIRLTNNSFDQLLDIMFELKMNFDESQKTPVIRINEYSNMAISALPPANNNVYIINYMKKNTFVKNGEEKRYALCKDYMQDAVTVKNGIFDTLSIDELKEMDLKLYKYNGDVEFNSVLEKAEDDTDFYRILTGREMLDSDQIKYDALFEEVFPFTSMLNMMTESLTSTMKQSLPQNKMVYEGVSLPYFELESMNKNDSIVKFYRDIDGIFLMNEETRFRTKSYDDSNILEEFRNDIANMLIEAKRVKGREYEYISADIQGNAYYDKDGNVHAKEKMATTSIGKGGILDSIAQSHIEELNIEKEKIILESENIVQEYVFYCIGEIKKIVNNQRYNKSQLANRLYDDYKFLYDNRVDPRKIDEAIMGNYFGLDYIYKNYNKMSDDEGRSEEEISNELKKNKQAQQIITHILKMRLNYVNRITQLLQEMMKLNYKQLGLTEQEAQTYIDALSKGNNESTKAVADIIDLVKENKEKFINGTIVDLTQLGFGRIYGTTKDMNTVGSTNNHDAMINLFQRAMRYDAVVLAHGSSRSHGGLADFKDMYINEIRRRVSINKEKMNWDAVSWLVKRIDRSDILDMTFDLIRKGGHDNEIIETAKNSQGPNELYQLALKYTNEHLDYVKNYYRARDEEIKNQYEWATKKLTNEELKKAILDIYDNIITLKLICSSGDYIHDLIIDKFDKKWTCQPTNTLKAGPFTDVNDLVRELIKEGNKKICIEDCNPGGHKLADDIMKTKGVLINYSSFSNWVESAISDTDSEIINEIAELEDGLKQLALEADIDYDDNEYLLECMDWAQNNLDAINEGKIVDSLLNIFKKVIGAIIGFFKKIIHLFGLLISKVKELFSGTKEAPKNVKKEFPELSAKIASPKDKKMVEIKGKTREELQTQTEKINSGIGSSIKAIQAQQNKDISRIKQDIITLEKAEQEIKAGKK